MAEKKRRINLVSGPKRVAEIEDGILPLSKEADSLRKANEADAELLAGVRKDPYANQPPGTHPLLSEIREWVKERDKESAVIEERMGGRGEMLAELEGKMRPGREELRAIQKEMDGRERRLQGLREIKARDDKFAGKLDDPFVMSEFIVRHSGLIVDYLGEKGIESSIWDKVDRDMHRIKMEGEPYRLRRLAGLSVELEIPPWRLSSVKTLAAVYAQLSREVGYPVRKGFEEGFTQVLKKAGIKRILEVGPQSRGLVSVLAESGIAGKAGIELSAIDMFDRKDEIAHFRESGIRHVIGNAADAAGVFKDESFDLILAVGVMSGGGIQEGEGAEDYPGMVEKSHRIADGLAPMLSSNPHAMLAASGIHGTLTLFQDRLTDKYDIAYWQHPPREAIENDRERAYPDSPLARIRGTSHTSRQGRQYVEWFKKNQERIEYIDGLFDQSTDLAILKKKK